MSTAARVLGLALGLALAASSVSAQTYRTLAGSLSGPEPDPGQPLTGQFSVLPAIGTPPATQERRTFNVTDFALQAGDRSFTPAPPVEFDGLVSIAVTPFNTIELIGDDVAAVKLRSGNGEVIRSSATEVTFRFRELRSDPSDPGRAVGAFSCDIGILPRRLHLTGTLYEVEQTYLIQRFCNPILTPTDATSGDITLVAHGGGGPPSEHDSGGGRVVIVVPNCEGLWPVEPAFERSVGRFRLVATAAQPIAIDVQPARAINVVVPGSPGRVPVAILGDEHLDVSQIGARSLRLGDAEAEPEPGPDRESTHERDVDRDGDLDLVARFSVRDTGLAFGDDLLCLVAQSFPLETLEGCDAIQTIPRR